MKLTRIKVFIKAFIAGFKQYDKKLHFAAGLCIALIFGLFNPLLGFVLAVGAGALKEIIDQEGGKGTPELLDFVFTALGGAIGALLYVLSSSIISI